jgi:integrase
MAGTVTFAKLENPTSRARLKRGRGPHWRDLGLKVGISRAHLGYQRWPEDREGRWLLRIYRGGRYSVAPLGQADDAREADADAVLSWEQATAKARAQVGASPVKQHRLTVRKVMALYIEHKERQGQPTRDLISRTDAHIIPALGDKIVADLTSAEIRQWVATLAGSAAMVRSKKDGKQNYKPDQDDDEAVRRRRSSANRVLTMLKAALNHAYDEGHVTSNEAWGRRVKPFAAVDVARVRYLTVAEAKRLINATDPEFRPLVQAALQTGCRYGELIRLEVHDFNGDTGTLAIRKSKSGKARHVVLTDEGAGFFRQATAGRAGNELIFRRTDGAPWKASHQGRPMSESCERAKISPPVGIHQLRHTWASHAVMNGVPLMVVAKNLGHVDTRMVEKHYGHLASSYISDAIRAGAPRFGFKPHNKIATLRTKRQ